MHLDHPRRLSPVPWIVCLLTLMACEPDNGNKLSAYINGIGEIALSNTAGDPKAAQHDSSDFSYFQILDVNPDTLYAGDVVQGKATAQNAGALLPVSLPRNSGTVTITQVRFQDQNALTSVHLESPSLASVTKAEQQLTSQKFVPEQSGVVASSYKAVYSSDHARLQAKASFSGFGVNANSFFSTANDTTKNHVLFTLNQSFYSISFVPDARKDGVSGPARFFAPNTTVDAAKPYISETNPPLYIASITYGRSLYFMASSTASTNDIIASLNAAYTSLSASGSIQLSDEERSTLNTTEITVLSIGGRSAGVQAVLRTLNGSDVPTALAEYIKNELDFSASPDMAQEVGYPIYYTLRYLDGDLAKVSNVTYYNPTAVNPLTTQKLEFHVTIDDDDKEKETPVRVTVIGADGSVLHVGRDDEYGPLGQQPFYWGKHGEDHDLPVSLNAPVPLYQLANCRLTIDAPGDTWHAYMWVDADVSDGSMKLVSDRTRTIRFNDGDGSSWTIGLKVP